MLRSFPLQEDGQNKSGDAPNGADGSDGEFEIFEQPSDNDESSDGQMGFHGSYVPELQFCKHIDQMHLTMALLNLHDY